MKVALICPPSLLKKYGTRTRYHMVLPHLVHQKRYQDFFQTRSKKGDFLILDNGAAEGVEFGHRHLLTIASMLGITEIIIPDVLGDKEETLARAMAFNRYAQSADDFRYMAVAQGQNVSEVIQSIHFYLETSALQYITCVGIPRLICGLDKDHGSNSRLLVVEYIQRMGLDVAMEYHMLGSTSWTHEVAELSHYPCVRGIDTSMPLVMGLADRDLMLDKYLPRGSDFFDTNHDHPLIQRNIDLFLSWAKYDGT